MGDTGIACHVLISLEQLSFSFLKTFFYLFLIIIFIVLFGCDYIEIYGSGCDKLHGEGFLCE